MSTWRPSFKDLGARPFVTTKPRLISGGAFVLCVSICRLDARVVLPSAVVCAVDRFGVGLQERAPLGVVDDFHQAMIN